MGKRLDSYLSREGIQMPNQLMKRCRTPPVIREMQIKPTIRIYYAPIRITAMTKIYTPNVGWDVEKIGISFILTRCVNLAISY
jgi:hypothetical protein